MSFDGKTIKSSDTVKLLKITLDKNINLKRHVQKFFRKANNKTKALFCVKKCLNLEQAQVLAETYISSNFRYCPLVCKFFGKMSIAKTHYRTPRARYDTQTRSYQELLELSKCRTKTNGLNTALFKGTFLYAYLYGTFVD